MNVLPYIGTIPASEQEAINHALQNSVSALDLSKRKEIEFDASTEVKNSDDVPSIVGSVIITSAVLNEEVSKRIRTAFDMPKNTMLRLEVEPRIVVRNIKQNAGGAWQLTCTEGVDYSASSSDRDIAILSCNQDVVGEDEHYNPDNWTRHWLQADLMHRAALKHLDSGLYSDNVLPLIQGFIEHHNGTQQADPLNQAKESEMSHISIKPEGDAIISLPRAEVIKRFEALYPEWAAEFGVDYMVNKKDFDVIDMGYAACAFKVIDIDTAATEAGLSSFNRDIWTDENKDDAIASWIEDIECKHSGFVVSNHDGFNTQFFVEG